MLKFTGITFRALANREEVALFLRLLHELELHQLLLLLLRRRMPELAIGAIPTLRVVLAKVTHFQNIWLHTHFTFKLNN